MQRSKLINNKLFNFIFNKVNKINLLKNNDEIDLVRRRRRSEGNSSEKGVRLRGRSAAATGRPDLSPLQSLAFVIQGKSP